jgi:His-Xaa-Ser system protein HxsD
MTKNSGVQIRLDGAYYPKEAVISTCCQFLADNYVFLEKAGSSDIKVTLAPKGNAGKASKLLREIFQSELMSNTLRYNVSLRNKDLRDYIIKSALVFSQGSGAQSSSALADLEKDSKKYLAAQGDDWKDDPLGIAVPWEDKKKKKPKAKKKKC